MKTAYLHMSRLTARQLLNIKRAPQKDLMEPVSQPDSRLNLLQPPTADHMSESDYQSQHPASHRTVTVLQSQRNFNTHKIILQKTVPWEPCHGWNPEKSRGFVSKRLKMRAWKRKKKNVTHHSSLLHLDQDLISSRLDRLLQQLAAA